MLDKTCLSSRTGREKFKNKPKKTKTYVQQIKYSAYPYA